MTATLTSLNLTEWDAFLTQYPDVHLLQTGTWGDFKAEFGWQVTRVAVEGKPSVGAQVLFRSLPFGFSWAYIAKGPVGGRRIPGKAPDWSALWPAVDAACRQQKAVFLKVEPDLWERTPPEEPLPPPGGFFLSRHTIQPPRTLVVDLNGEEEQILGRMKQKTRYNIRLAQKKGVMVRPSADLKMFYRLMKLTGERDAFGVHSQAYFQRAYEFFYPQGKCELLVAEYDGEPLAALMVFAQGRRAWYFYGASSDAHRERMPTYLLQWDAMRWARERGCSEYDLWGVPDADESTLEGNFLNRLGGLWGVYRFKRGFGGQLLRSAGPWDRVYQPLLYSFYRIWAGRRQEGG